MNATPANAPRRSVPCTAEERGASSPCPPSADRQPRTHRNEGPRTSPGAYRATSAASEPPQPAAATPADSVNPKYDTPPHPTATRNPAAAPDRLPPHARALTESPAPHLAPSAPSARSRPLAPATPPSDPPRSPAATRPRRAEGSAAPRPKAPRSETRPDSLLPPTPYNPRRRSDLRHAARARDE